MMGMGLRQQQQTLPGPPDHPPDSSEVPAPPQEDIEGRRCLCRGDLPLATTLHHTGLFGRAKQPEKERPLEFRFMSVPTAPAWAWSRCLHLRVMPTTSQVGHLPDSLGRMESSDPFCVRASFQFPGRKRPFLQWRWHSAM